MDEKIYVSLATKLPAHVSQPLIRMVGAPNYFKKLHLVSDVLLGFLRLYGHSTIEIAKHENAIDQSLELSIERLLTKDSQGLWSSTIAKLIQGLDEKKSNFLSPELASIFGVTIKSLSQPSIDKYTVTYSIIDGKGQKQQRKITNTSVELLINFRNKYVGHGTVYSENESKRIYKLYTPILEALLQSLLLCKDFQFMDETTGLDLIGPEQSCSGSIVLKYKSNSFTFRSVHQLKVDSTPIEVFDHGNALAEQDAADKMIMEQYPYFLAYPYKRALEENENFKRLHLLKEVFLNYLKYLGLLTASEYFNSELKIGEINRAFNKFLYRPQFGYWNAFIRNAIKSLNEHDHQWFIKELPGYYDEIETRPYQENETTSIGKLIDFRNYSLGHSTMPSEKECIILWKENFQLLKELLLKLDFCRNYTLVSSDKAITWRLMGHEITRVNLRQNLESNVSILDPDNRELNIVPFFILPGKYFIKEISDQTNLMVYEQNTGSRIIFFSPESVYGETNNEEVLEQLNLMIREKEKREPVSIKNLNRAQWTALLNENNEDVLQTLINERKVIRGVYQERKEAEIALRSWIGALPGLFFLAAEAGSGKTNVLVEMSRQYTERGLDTILLRGNRFRSPDILEELCFRLNLTDDSIIEDAGFLNYEKEKPLMILIDGVNEHSNADTLLLSCLKFLEQHKGGHIKIIISWRVNLKTELPSVDDKYSSLIYRDSNEDDKDLNIIAKSCHWLRPLDKTSIESAWTKYVTDQQNKVHRKPKFTYEELSYHDRSLSEQLSNPLLLRLFLELNNGKGLPKDREGYVSVWTLYHEMLISQ